MVIVFNILLLLFIGAAVLVIPYLLGLLKIFFTIPKEGTVEAIMKGGKSHRFVMAFRGYHLNDPTNEPDYKKVIDGKAIDDWEVLPGDPVSDSSVLGMYWMGIPPWYKVHRYKFRWTEWIQPQDNTTNIAVGRDELTPLILVKDFPYYAKVINAKTNSGGKEDDGELLGGEQLPVNMEYVLTVRCTNPYKALFATEDWLAQIIGVCDGEARNYIGQRTYEDLASELDKKDADGKLVTGDDSLGKKLLALNELMPNGQSGMKKTFGIEVVRVDVISIGLTPEAEKRLGEATTKKYVARREADAREIEADGRARAAIKDAEATQTAAGAEAFRIKTVSTALKEGGDQAMAAMYFDAIGKAGAGGSSIIFGAKPGEVSKDTLIYGAIEKNDTGGEKGGAK